VRSLEEHRDAVLAAITPLPPARRALADCLGLVLCEDVTSLVDLPGFDNSAMDGYAVRAADVAGADPADPGTAVRLPVVGEVAAGGVASRAVGPREAVRIMTGAMMPDGADAVVRVEDTDGGTGTVEVRAGVPAGTSVRPAGEDVRQGQVVLEAGATIDARRVALLAATGHADALVRRRPRVAVVSTGAELVPPGKPLRPGQIHESNSYMLEAAVVAAGAEAVRQPTLDDDPAAVLSAVAALSADVDAIVTSGGVSMGAYDVVKESLRDHGVDFVQVAMQPGKPQGFGFVGEDATPIITLPGNPVSSYVSFEVFVVPAIRRMMGLLPYRRPTVRALCTQGFSSIPGRQQYVRARIEYGDQTQVTPVGGQGSHLIGGLSEANALVVVPSGATAVEAGSQVQVLPLDRDF
jgi:molybdopterin molybdotransferase